MSESCVFFSSAIAASDGVMGVSGLLEERNLIA